VSRLSPKGNALQYSTFITGSELTTLRGIAVDAQRRAYITGFTRAADYPTTADAVQTTCYQFPNSTQCFDNAVVSVLDGEGANLLYSTYFGAAVPNGNRGHAIAVDASGSFYITGESDAGLLTTPGAVQPSNPGSRTGFAAKFSRVAEE
jgi:hypothetical protein